MDNDILKTLTPDQLEMLAAQLEEQRAAKVLRFPDIDEKGKPNKTIANVRALANFFGITIRYNEMSKDVEITIPGFKKTGDLYNNAVLGKLNSICYENNFPISKDILMDYVNLMAHENEYHPARSWIDAQVWDGKSRLQELYDSVILKNSHPLKETILRKWTLSVVAALYKTPFSCEGVLTFSGSQGIGKTTWIEQLLPPEGINVWNKDAVVLNMTNKDSQFKALSSWITELGEVDATFKKSDIEALKGFITEKVDSLRSPYERKANNYPRRTVFYATVNERQFLQDTENRRFWVLDVERFANTITDAGQLWAELKHMYEIINPKITTKADREANNEWGWFMSPNERRQMSPLQTTHRVTNPIDELLADNLKPYNIVDAGAWDWKSATAILRHCGIQVPNKAQANDATKWLRANMYQEDSRCRFKCEFNDTRILPTVAYGNSDSILAQKMDKMRKNRD